MPNIIAALLFLSLISLLNMNIHDLISSTYERKVHEKSYAGRYEKELLDQSVQIYHKLKAPEHKPKQKNPVSAVKKSRKFKRKKTPPQNAKFNLNLIQFYQEKAQIVLTRLIQILYAGSEIDANVQAYCPLFIEALSEKINAKEFKTEYDIATLEFESEEIQTVWYLMLKGKAGAFPSLLNYVMLSPQKWLTNTGKVNIHYASKPLIDALGNSSTFTEELISMRKSYILPQSEEKQLLQPLIEQKLPKEEQEVFNIMIDYTKGMAFQHPSEDEEEASL